MLKKSKSSLIYQDKMRTRILITMFFFIAILLGHKATIALEQDIKTGIIELRITSNKSTVSKAIQHGLGNRPVCILVRPLVGALGEDKGMSQKLAFLEAQVKEPHDGSFVIVAQAKDGVITLPIMWIAFAASDMGVEKERSAGEIKFKVKRKSESRSKVIEHGFGPNPVAIIVGYIDKIGGKPAVCYPSPAITRTRNELAYLRTKLSRPFDGTFRIVSRSVRKNRTVKFRWVAFTNRHEVEAIRKFNIESKTQTIWPNIQFDKSSTFITLLRRDPPEPTKKMKRRDEEVISLGRSMALRFLKNCIDELGIDKFTDLEIDRIRKHNYPQWLDEKRDFDIIVQYHQEFASIPVFGSYGEVVLSADLKVYKLRQNWYPNITAPTTPKISKIQLNDIIRKHYGTQHWEVLKEPILIILPELNALAWKIGLGEPIFKDVFVNALTGNILMEKENIYRQVNIKVKGDIDGKSGGGPLKPLLHAKVELLDKKGNILQTQFTDWNGEFTFDPKYDKQAAQIRTSLKDISHVEILDGSTNNVISKTIILPSNYFIFNSDDLEREGSCAFFWLHQAINWIGLDYKKELVTAYVREPNVGAYCSDQQVHYGPGLSTLSSGGTILHEFSHALWNENYDSKALGSVFAGKCPFHDQKHPYDPNICPDFNDSFDDNISSIQIINGKWTCYHDRDYQKKMKEYGKDIENIKDEWNDRLSSVELTGLANTTEQRPEIILYMHSNFRGPHIHVIDHHVKNLNLPEWNWWEGKWNDAISSIQVISGTWKVYEHAEFKGKSITLTPGNYSLISNYGIANDAISSIEFVSETPKEQPNYHVILYRDKDFRGPHIHIIDRDEENLAHPEWENRWNDDISSIQVLSGKWKFYQHKDFGGKMIQLGPGLYPDLSQSPYKLDDQISSIKRSAGTDKLNSGKYGEIILYEHNNFRGPHHHVIADVIGNGEADLNKVKGGLRYHYCRNHGHNDCSQDAMIEGWAGFFPRCVFDDYPNIVKIFNKVGYDYNKAKEWVEENAYHSVGGIGYIPQMATAILNDLADPENDKDNDPISLGDDYICKFILDYCPGTIKELYVYLYEHVSPSTLRKGIWEVFHSKAGPSRTVYLDQTLLNLSANRALDKFGWSFAAGYFLKKDVYQDLAIGAPGKLVYNGNKYVRAGGVYLIYGNPEGIGKNNDTVFLHQPAKMNEEGDNFGHSLAIGDFNGDSAYDLAVGVPNKKVNGIETGAVFIYWGTSFGLDFDNFEIITPQQYSAGKDKIDFGYALLSYDFDKDGYWELVIGAPGDYVPDASGNDVKSGAVYLLTIKDANINLKRITQNLKKANMNFDGDKFGFSLAQGDFNHDTYAELVVGVPGKDLINNKDVGCVYVFLGTNTGIDTNTVVVLDQTYFINPGKNEAYDQFGYSLATGDLNGDGTDDLCVGIPFKNKGALKDQGLVSVFYGQQIPWGYGTWYAQNLYFNKMDTISAWHCKGPYESHQKPQESAKFGFSLAIGDVNDDNIADLIIAEPWRDIGPEKDAGQIYFFPGSEDGVSKGRYYRKDVIRRNKFGYALAVADLDNDGVKNLIAGSPYKDNARGGVYIYSTSMIDKKPPSKSYYVDLAIQLTLTLWELGVQPNLPITFEDIYLDSNTESQQFGSGVYCYTVETSKQADFDGEYTGWDYYGSVLYTYDLFNYLKKKLKDQNELYFRIKAMDCAGNVSDYTGPYKFTCK